MLLDQFRGTARAPGTLISPCARPVVISAVRTIIQLVVEARGANGVDAWPSACYGGSRPKLPPARVSLLRPPVGLKRAVRALTRTKPSTDRSTWKTTARHPGTMQRTCL